MHIADAIEADPYGRWRKNPATWMQMDRKLKEFENELSSLGLDRREVSDISERTVENFSSLFGDYLEDGKIHSISMGGFEDWLDDFVDEKYMRPIAQLVKDKGKQISKRV